MRAFVAFTLPHETRATLKRATDALIDAAPDWAGEKWVPPSNLHVTVEFIGQLYEEAVPVTIEALERTCAALAPFTLSLGDIVPKPGGRHPRMLWARFFDGVEPARRTAEAVREALVDAIALEPDERTFTPHVTLARLRVPRRVPAEALAAANAVLDSAAPACGVPSGTSATFVSVRHVTLMSSRLGHGAPQYEEVAAIPLGSD